MYELIARNIAPSIFGSEDIKKSIACLLFGGSRKRLPDGLTRRGEESLIFKAALHLAPPPHLAWLDPNCNTLVE